VPDLLKSIPDNIVSSIFITWFVTLPHLFLFRSYWSKLLQPKKQKSCS